MGPRQTESSTSNLTALSNHWAEDLGTGTGKTRQELIDDETRQATALQKRGMVAQFGPVWTEDCLDKLASYGPTRAHLDDAGYVAVIRQLIEHPEETPEHTRDPRILQAIAHLQGWELGVSHQDLQQAARHGDTPSPSPLSAADRRAAESCATPGEAKQQGTAAGPSCRSKLCSTTRPTGDEGVALDGRQLSLQGWSLPGRAGLLGEGARDGGRC